jgi:hypothetical protein
MFGKKQPATPKTPWTVQVLTRDYLVEGSTDGDDPTGPWFVTVQAEDLAMATLTLTQPNFQPTAGVSGTLRPASKWVLPSTAEFVAVIPRDPGSTAYALKHRGPHGATLAAEVLVGQFAIRGTLLSPDNDLDILAGYQTFGMQDVVIDCLAPGARLTNFAAPYLVVRTLLLQGILLNS